MSDNLVKRVKDLEERLAELELSIAVERIWSDFRNRHTRYEDTYRHNYDDGKAKLHKFLDSQPRAKRIDDIIHSLNEEQKRQDEEQKRRDDDKERIKQNKHNAYMLKKKLDPPSLPWNYRDG